MGRAVKAVVCSVAGCLALLLAPASGPVATAGAASYRVAPPQCRVVVPVKQGTAAPGFAAAQHDARAQASFLTRFTPDGRAQMVARAGELEVEKTVAPDGSFAAVLKAGHDEVRLGLRMVGLDISRGERSIHVELGQASDAELLQVKELLAGSRAIRGHRVLAGNLETKTLRTPAGAATLVLDALLGALDGDPSAIERLNERITRRSQATARRVRGKDEHDCYLEWENEVMKAWWSYAACMASFSIWNPFKEVCTARYLLWVESAWWHFIACSAFPLRLD